MVRNFLPFPGSFGEHLVVFRLHPFTVEHFRYFPKSHSFVHVEAEYAFHEFRFFFVHDELLSSGIAFESVSEFRIASPDIVAHLRFLYFSGDRPVAYKVAFHFADDPEHGKHHLSGGILDIEPLVHRFESHSVLDEFLDMLEEVEVLAKESVDLFDEHEIKFVVRGIEHELLEGGTAFGSSGEPPIDIDVPFLVQDISIAFRIFDEAFRLVFYGDSLGNLFLGRYPHVQCDPYFFV